MKSLHSILMAAGFLLATPAHALTIEFDYTHDTKGFFTDLVTGAPILERRSLLD